MKITRPALITATALTVAAAAIPFGAQADESTTTAATASAIASATPSAAKTAATTTVTQTVEVAATPEVAPEVDAIGSIPDGDQAGLPKVIDTALRPEASGPELQNMPGANAPKADRASTPQNVKPLTEAPKMYGQTKDGKKRDQGWYEWITKLPGGEAVSVYSESMGRDIPVALIRATDANGNPIANAPTYYLLNGAGGGEQNADWIYSAFANVRDTLANEPVNVVVPMEGAFSYYVDWLTVPEENDYFKGPQMWSTFLGTELPNSIEPYMQANDKRAVSGFSMSATSSLLVAEHNPGRYAAVGSFSGCAATSTALPSFFVGLTVNRGAQGTQSVTPENLWGPRGSEYNRYNDALVMADNLRDTGIKVYLSSGTGLPAETDMFGYLHNERKLKPLAAAQNSSTLKVEGGAIEAAMNACTHDLNTKLTAMGVDVSFNKRPTGTHSWSLWRDDLAVSWDQVIKPALGL
ncbi:alpha/beta hydrolase [Corynebacterium glaucum]|nr:alpha/beta hydrolase family protein [Corynebacterium glaucum]